MRTDELREAYDALRPDADTRDAMLRNILAAEPSKEAETPKKRTRRWGLPLLGAAAALLCVVLLQPAPESPAGEPPPPALVQSTRPHGPVGSMAPAPVSYEGRTYLPDRIAPAPEAGELLETLENGTLHAIPGTEPAEAVALVRDGETILCRVLPAAEN